MKKSISEHRIVGNNSIRIGWRKNLPLDFYKQRRVANSVEGRHTAEPTSISKAYSNKNNSILFPVLSKNKENKAPSLYFKRNLTEFE